MHRVYIIIASLMLPNYFIIMYCSKNNKNCINAYMYLFTYFMYYFNVCNKV